MAAGQFKLYNRGKKKAGGTAINLAAATWRMALVKSTSNFATATISLWGSVTNEVASGNGYSSSGKALASEVWTGTASAGSATIKFDAADPVWTAAGGAISSIFGCVIFASGASAGACHVLAYCTLTGTAFALGAGSTFTVTLPATGIFVAY